MEQWSIKKGLSILFDKVLFMKTTIKFLVIFGLLLNGFDGWGQNLSNRGKEFWVGYGHHQFMEAGTNTMEMVLYLSAEQTANVTVTIDSSGWSKNYVVPAGSVIISDFIPKIGFYDARLYNTNCGIVPGIDCGGEGFFRKKEFIL